jgi:hypothetical protein
MDIDIDFLNRQDALKHLKHIVAGRHTDTGMVAHNTGIYVQNIPYNPLTNLSTIDYKSAEDRGYFKIDFLNVNVYDGVKDNNHLLSLMEAEPIWDLLLNEEFVNLLFHLNGHGDILKQTLPTSVEQLAAVLAMIRPAKRYLIGKDWTTIMNEVWVKPTNGGYYFKHAHAISYAMVVIVQMNLLVEQLSSSTN